MADNVTTQSSTLASIPASTGIATDEVTYSGDASQHIAPSSLVHISGSEGSKTAASLSKAEDAAHTSGDPGIPLLAVRVDTAASLCGTDGDYAPPQLNATGALRVEVSSVAANSSVIQDDAAFTPGTSYVAVIGGQADEASTDSVDEGDAGAVRITLDRKLIVNNQPHTAGGCSIFRSLDIDETEEDVKTAAGQLYGFYFVNNATSKRYLKFYNATAANVTVGTTTPVLTFPLPANASDAIAGWIGFGGVGVAFDTAISVACTTGLADNDTGAPSANDVVINVIYK